MTEPMVQENLPMDEFTKEIHPEKLDHLHPYFNTNFKQRNESIKKLLCYSNKVVTDRFFHSKREGVPLIIPTAEALENWQMQSKALG